MNVPIDAKIVKWQQINTTMFDNSVSAMLTLKPNKRLRLTFAEFVRWIDNVLRNQWQNQKDYSMFPMNSVNVFHIASTHAIRCFVTHLKPLTIDFAMNKRWHDPNHSEEDWWQSDYAIADSSTTLIYSTQVRISKLHSPLGISLFPFERPFFPSKLSPFVPLL